jgi:membrane-associated phospholipid phosphatase
VLLVRSVLAIVVCAALVVICYFFVDRPVAWFVHAHNPDWPFLKQPTLVPPFLIRSATLGLVLAVLWRVWRPGSRGQETLLTLSLSPIVAVAMKESLKWASGRYWPETWTRNPLPNPSLIQDHAYGFHPFHSGVAYESFPSGHTTIVFALVAVAWLVFPRLRWLWALAGSVIVVALLGMNYHFVGDVIAGAFLGSITGVWTARLRAQ